MQRFVGATLIVLFLFFAGMGHAQAVDTSGSYAPLSPEEFHDVFAQYLNNQSDPQGDAPADETAPPKKLSVYQRLIRAIRRGNAERTATILAKIQASVDKKIAGYDQLLTKVKTRKQKLADMGKDVTKIDIKIQDAEQEIAEQKTAIQTAKTTIENLDLSKEKNLQVNVQTVKAQIKIIKNGFNSLHKAFKEVSKAMREA